MIIGRGSMIGEEDAISRNNYSCSVKCHSLNGSLFAIKREDFITLRKSDDSWLNILEKALWKEQKKRGDFINKQPLQKISKKEKDKDD